MFNLSNFLGSLQFILTQPLELFIGCRYISDSLFYMVGQPLSRLIILHETAYGRLAVLWKIVHNRYLYHSIATWLLTH